MDFYINQSGLRVSADQFKQVFGNASRDIIEKYSLHYTPKIGATKTCKLYRLVQCDGKYYLILPRMAIADYIKHGLVKSLTGKFQLNPIAAKMRPTIALFDYQKIVVDYILNNVFTRSRADKGLASCTLNLRAGAGKTLVAAALCAQIGARMLYVTPLEHLALQARDEFMRFLDGVNIAINYKRTHATNNDDTGIPDINIVIINTANTLTYSELSQYSFIVYDEVHAYCSERRKDIFWKAQSMYTLGMSATTNHRDDGFDKIYYKHLGEPIHAAKLPGFKFDEIKFNLNVKFIKYYGPADYTRNLTHAGKVSVHLMYRQFMKDQSRMNLICDEISKLYADPRRNIYVFAEERENLQDIMKSYISYLADKKRDDGAIDDDIPDIAMYDNECIGYFVGGLPIADINRIKDTSRIVFTTYRLSATGTSWQKMNAMILATPRKSGIEQLAGRILRKGSDVTIPRDIIDIVDIKTCLCHQMKFRKQSYKIYEPKVEKVSYRAISTLTKTAQSRCKGARKQYKIIPSTKQIETPACLLPIDIVE